MRGRAAEIPENRRRLHWAQLQTYGALFCQARGLAEIRLALVYFDVDSREEEETTEVFGAAELESLFMARCGQFEAWARDEARHRRARDGALAGLAFPQAPFRAGQRELAEAVYRAAKQGRCLLAQAPTGIGKTVGTLYPMLRAMPGQGIDKLAYLTCKGTGRLAALASLQILRDHTAGRALRVHCLFQFFVANGKLSLPALPALGRCLPWRAFQHRVLCVACHAHGEGDEAGAGRVRAQSFGDVHLYANHFEQARLQLQRQPKALPRLELNPSKSDLFGWDYEDFTLHDYAPDSLT